MQVHSLIGLLCLRIFADPSSRNGLDDGLFMMGTATNLCVVLLATYMVVMQTKYWTWYHTFFDLFSIGTWLLFVAVYSRLSPTSSLGKDFYGVWAAMVSRGGVGLTALLLPFAVAFLSRAPAQYWRAMYRPTLQTVLAEEARLAPAGTVLAAAATAAPPRLQAAASPANALPDAANMVLRHTHASGSSASSSDEGERAAGLGRRIVSTVAAAAEQPLPEPAAPQRHWSSFYMQETGRLEQMDPYTLSFHTSSALETQYRLALQQRHTVLARYWASCTDGGGQNVLGA